MADVNVMCCSKCRTKLFCLVIYPDKSTLFCANPACGNPQLELKGSPEVFKRQPQESVNAKPISPIITH